MRSDAEAFCATGADPLVLLGVGLAPKTTRTRSHRPVRVYYLPLTATAFIRTGEMFSESPGYGMVEHRTEVQIAAGIGNGAGVQLRVGTLTAVPEVRVILIKDLNGVRGGSLPVSLGIRW
jgi:hypothetical protein